MAATGINSEDRLVQKTFSDHLEQVLDWDSVYARKLGDLRPWWHIIAFNRNAVSDQVLPVRWIGHLNATSTRTRRSGAGGDGERRSMSGIVGTESA